MEITPPKVQYELQHTVNGVTNIYDVTDDFKDWAEFDSQIIRDGVSGAYKSIKSDGISFTGDAYDIVRSIYETEGFTATAKLVIRLRKDDFPDLWTYVDKLVLDLNFSTYEMSLSEITLDANQNELSEIVKSKKSTTYEIPVTDADSSRINYDGLIIQESSSFTTGEVDYSQGFNTDQGQWVIEPNVYTDYNTPVGNEGVGYFCPSLYVESDDTNAKYKNLITRSDQPLKRYKRLTSTTYRWEEWNSVSWSESAMPVTFKSEGKQSFIISINGKLTVNLSQNHAYDSVSGDIKSGAFYLIRDDVPSNYASHIKICDLPEVSHEVLGDLVWDINASVNVPNDYNSANYYVLFVFKFNKTNPGNNSEAFYNRKFEFETGSSLKIAWNTGLKQSYGISMVTHQYLLQQLINKMSQTTGVYTAVVDDTPLEMRLVAGESIRQWANPKFHTSFDNFCKYIRSCFGYEYEINGNTIHFSLRDNFFLNELADTIEDVNDLHIKVNTDHIFTDVKIGISKVDYQMVNGTDEFRFAEIWSTGVTNVQNSLDLTSPYRTDSYGFQLLVEKIGETTTDNESDTSVFALHVKNDGLNYILDRTATITGVISPTTMFNVLLSPRQCLLRNASYLGVSTNKLTFSSGDGNSDVAINGTSEKSDIAISQKLFMPDVINLSIGEITDLPAIKNGYVQFDYENKTYKGFIKELNHYWGEPKSTELTLFRVADTTVIANNPVYTASWNGFVCQLSSNANTGKQMALTLDVVETINGEIINTLVHNVSDLFGSYLAISVSDLQQLSESEYVTRLNNFCSYVESLYSGLSIDKTGIFVDNLSNCPLPSNGGSGTAYYAYMGSVDFFATKEEAQANYTASRGYFTNTNGAITGGVLYNDNSLSNAVSSRNLLFVALRKDGTEPIIWVQLDESGNIIDSGTY